MNTSQRLVDSSTGHTGHWTADKLSLVPDLAAETPGQWSRVTCHVSRGRVTHLLLPAHVTTVNYPLMRRYQQCITPIRRRADICFQEFRGILQLGLHKNPDKCP